MKYNKIKYLSTYPRKLQLFKIVEVRSVFVFKAFSANVYEAHQ